MKKLFLLAVVFSAAGTLAAADEVSAREVSFAVNNLWVMGGAMLVFLMHLGFASVESGLCRAKNCTNILFKNTVTPAIGFLTFAICGFSLMYPGETHWLWGKMFGFAGFGLKLPAGNPIDYAGGKYTYWSDFLFQGMFAATAATIVSGAVAERIKLHSYLIFTVVYLALVYPIAGSWGWGGGFLAGLGFHDFAGSTFVHSVGGWAALAGILVLGPRIGKYVNGKAQPIMGHSMPLATIGVFCLWLGWFGFNGGSVLSANPEKVSYVLVTTMFGASAGIIGALLASFAILKKPDHSMMLNGCLAGLVAITAGADCISIVASIIIGAIGGGLVVLSVLFFDQLEIDDPVGALSVHLVNGIWGTLAVGIFAADAAAGITLSAQIWGIIAVGVFAFPSALLIFYLTKLAVGIRISEAEEMRGLDVDEHGMEAYPGFQFFSNQ